MEIRSTSPLLNFWQSPQLESDEVLRLSLVNDESTESTKNRLFELEPYKWEVLYDFSVLRVSQGDFHALKALYVLLSMLRIEISLQTVDLLYSQGFLNEGFSLTLRNLLLNRITTEEFDNPPLLFLIHRFILVIFSIFFNPSDIHIKNKKKRKTSYEQMGYLCYVVRKFLFLG